MKKYDLQGRLDGIYSKYPEATCEPLIGLTGNYSTGETRLCDKYYQAVFKAGATPIIIPPIADENVIINTLEKIDGLILTGGGDIDPLWVGEEPSLNLGTINEARDEAELLTVRLAFNRQIPMLGICRGIQTMVMALEGEIFQDIKEGFLESGLIKEGEELKIKHSQAEERQVPTHEVKILKDSILYDLYKEETLMVNSIHHQAVRNPGKHFFTTAKSLDGVIEAIQSSEYKPMMGVQWHPEWLEEKGLEIFKWLAKEAKYFKEAKSLHREILTLDTHCDTPMFFSQGVHFSKRDPKILVDMHKMAEGKQDAVIMATYLPQPKENEKFSSLVPFKVNSPKEYADLIIDKIEDIVKENTSSIAIARNPEDLYLNKKKNLRSIVLAIENGLAIEKNLENIDHFFNRGVTYITLCHNGDNDICDSARGNSTHNGVSLFGQEVIKRMNSLGIMVDLSHASQESFFQALEISSSPIVCSHSNCKALLSSPRNLSDEQLLCLAKKGGVAHITLYGGFLNKDSSLASILDAIEHLEHAIKVMGIDHVGLGTDFDGDGGVRGLASSSELINFTSHLLKRRFSKEDIAKIWGGNWLRVMKITQNNAKKK